MERRLTAILAADVAGYSALMEIDEAGTYERLKVSRTELFEPEIARRRGRIFKLMGDGLLAEFSSVVDAVECAVALQLEMAKRNDSLSKAERFQIRIGINLGEVIVEGDDRYGEGVNVAARLEQLAEPGSVYLSGKVAREVEKKLTFGLEAIGKHKMKNLAEPVEVYRVNLDRSLLSRLGKPLVPRRAAHLWHGRAIAAIVLLFTIAAGAGLWLKMGESRFEPDLPLPARPSVAVLPFTNMSADPEQGYFADGITDNLITDLSKIPGLFVISRNSTFGYKDKQVDARQAAKKLGVRYVLEGSIQRSAGQLRINAQLIDAVDNGHVWADRFDGSLADVFTLQDKVTRSIAAALALRLRSTVGDALAENETDNPIAYDAFLRGMEHLRRRTPDEFLKAVPLFEQAIKLDPEYGQAYAALALIYVVSYQRRWFDTLQISDVETRIRAKHYLEEAQRLPTALSHQVAGQMLAANTDYQNALPEFKNAIALDPSDAGSYISMADALTLLGRPAEALPLIRAGMRLDPNYPPFFLSSLGMAQFKLQRFKDAAASFERVIGLAPDDEAPLLWLAASYAQLGRTQDAKTAVANYNELAVKRGGVPAAINTSIPHIRGGLLLAGVPHVLSESDFAVAHRINANEARRLFLGHRLHGRTLRTGAEHAAMVAPDGSATMMGDWATFPTGTLRFEGDAVCFVWSDSGKSCGGVSRNPGGTRAKENEFIWFLNQGAMTFSQRD
jgi:adenylate cyclase